MSTAVFALHSWMPQRIIIWAKVCDRSMTFSRNTVEPANSASGHSHSRFLSMTPNSAWRWHSLCLQLEQHLKFDIACEVCILFVGLERGFESYTWNFGKTIKFVLKDFMFSYFFEAFLGQTLALTAFELGRVRNVAAKTILYQKLKIFT